MALKPLMVMTALLALPLAACRTTAGQDASESKVAAADGAGLGTTLSLANEDGQALYLKVLEVELAAGIQVAKDQLHTSRGLFECHKDGELETCLLRVRLMGNDLSATQPLPPELAAKLWQFVRASRPDLAQERVVLTDLLCDYIGKKSPPYTVEGVHCTASLARSTEEAVFADSVAEELGDALRGDQPYGAGAVTLNGSVACQWLAGSPRTPCVVRAVVGGILAEKLTELTQGSASQAAKALLQAVTDHARLAPDAGTGTAKATPPPTEVMGALSCLIDNSRFESDGKRSYICRARI